MRKTTFLLLLNLLLCGIGPTMLGAELQASTHPPRKADIVLVGTARETSHR